jgi:hypothetical protein
MTSGRYLDGFGDPAAFCIGHGNPEVNAAIASQFAQVACGSLMHCELSATIPAVSDTSTHFRCGETGPRRTRRSPRVALNAVQLSVAEKMRPHIIDDRSFFSVAASCARRWRP